ncbi:MAG: hypothetical protein WB586_12295 [Chthoniobacterales bacterium]|jgi:hypothetical protein
MDETEFWEHWREQWRKALEPLFNDIDDGDGGDWLEEYLELAFERYGEPGRN